MIFGWRSKSGADWSGILRCTRCQKWRLHYGMRTKRQFTLYFLPVLPLGSNRKLMCASCLLETSVDESTFAQRRLQGEENRRIADGGGVPREELRSRPDSAPQPVQNRTQGPPSRNRIGLGIGGHALCPSEAKWLGVQYGLVVEAVSPGSGAAHAGLRDSKTGTADVILAVAGKPTKSFDDVVDYIEGKRAGDRVTLTVRRDGEDIQLTATLQVTAGHAAAPTHAPGCNRQHSQRQVCTVLGEGTTPAQTSPQSSEAAPIQDTSARDRQGRSPRSANQRANPTTGSPFAVPLTRDELPDDLPDDERLSKVFEAFFGERIRPDGAPPPSFRFEAAEGAGLEEKERTPDPSHELVGKPNDAAHGARNLAAVAAVVGIVLLLFGAPKVWASVASVWTSDERARSNPYPRQNDVRNNPLTGEREVLSGDGWIAAPVPSIAESGTPTPSTPESVDPSSPAYAAWYNHQMPVPGVASSQPTANNAAKPPNSKLRHWGSFPIHYCWAQPPSGRVTPALVALTERAFQTWSVSTSYDGVCAGQAKLGDGANEIAFGALTNSADIAAGMQEAGVTLVDCIDRTGADGCALAEADIILDYQAYVSVPDVDQAQCLLSTLIHETGHFLGLDHRAPPSVMQAVRSETCPIQLFPADRLAFRDRYGSQ